MRRIEDCVEIILRDSKKHIVNGKYICYLGLSVYRYLLDKYPEMPVEVANAAVLIDFYDYSNKKPGYLESKGFSLRTDYLVSVLEIRNANFFRKENETEYLNRIMLCYDIWASRILQAKYYLLYQHYSDQKNFDNDLSDKYEKLYVKLLKNVK